MEGDLNRETLLAAWEAEEQRTFSGWDFSYLGDRYAEPEPRWSYDDLARRLLHDCTTVLDVGTGGGERLSALAGLLPAQAYATEGWAPNVEIARHRLEPLGVRVVEYDIERDTRMPFENGAFDLVLDRHAAFDGEEIARVLRPGGRFLTQQVDGSTMADFSSVFARGAPNPNVTLAICGREVAEAGLEIEVGRESVGRIRFADVGALVYFARAAPWEVPADFSVRRYADVLLNLHATGRLSFDMGHFVIQARKPQADSTASPRG